MSAKKNIPHFSLFDRVLIGCYSISLTLFIYYFYLGSSFYLTPLTERPHHADYFTLKPGADRSHGFGMVGSSMMVLLLVYSLRKRSSLLGKKGKMKDWLNFHIFLGINGPLFIILHSTLKLNGIVVVSFWSMIAVALSGAIGRYLYLLIPRSQQGNELSLAEIKRLRQDIQQSLQMKYGLAWMETDTIRNIIYNRINSNSNLFFLALNLFLRVAALRFKTMTMRRYYQRKFELSNHEVKEFMLLLREVAILEQRINLWNRIQELFHYWHVFHKPFAVIMYLIMAIHIGVSVWLGYTWIF